MIDGVTCAEILLELSEKLESKLRFSPAQITDTIADLLGCFIFVTIPNTLNVVTNDPEDNKVLECAVVSKATHVITGDRKHLLPIIEYGGIYIVSPSDFLKEFWGNHNGT